MKKIEIVATIDGNKMIFIEDECKVVKKVERLVSSAKALGQKLEVEFRKIN